MTIPQLYVEVVHTCKGSTSATEIMQVNHRFELSGKYNSLVHALIKFINAQEIEDSLPIIYPEEGYTIVVEYGISDMIKLMSAIIAAPFMKANDAREVTHETHMFRNASNIKAHLEHIVETQDFPYPYINLVIEN